MLKAGDRAVIVRRVPMGAGSFSALVEGDEVEVVKVGEAHCAVRMHGTVFVVPTDSLERLRTEDAPASDPDPAADDDWWKF